MGKMKVKIMVLTLLLMLFNPGIFSQNLENQPKDSIVEDYKTQIQILWRNDIHKALLLTDQAIAFSEKNKLQRDKVNFVKMKAIGYYYMGRFFQMDSVLHQGLQHALSERQPKLTADFYNLLMVAKKKTNRYDSAVYYGKKTILIRKEMHDEVGLANAYDNLATTYYKIEDYTNAIELNNQSIAIYKQHKQWKDLAFAYGNLSNIYSSINDPKNTIKYLNKAYEILKNDEELAEPMASTLYNMAHHSMKYKQYDKAIAYTLQAQKTYKKLKKIDALGDVNELLGEVYLEKAAYTKAYPYLKKAAAYFHDAQIPDYEAESYLNLALLFIKQSQKDSAQFYLKKTKTLESSQSLQFQIKLKKAAIDYYKSIQEPTIALQKSEQLLVLKDSINTINLQESIHKKLLQFQLEKMENENIQLKQKQTIDALHNKQMKIVSAAAVALALFSLLSLYLFLKKRKKEKEISELKTKKAALLKRELETKLQANTRQLTSFALHMMQKNLILKDLLENIKKIETDANAESKKQLKNYKIKLLNAISSDQDWKTFESYFEKVNPEFTKRLKEKHPDLTHKDLKLSALIRLNMDIKEAASTLNVEANSVRIARYRLRKKLGLSPEDDLYAYMRSI